MATSRPILALVGGYLGAGKTTLLVEAARRLRNRGSRVALITNDQGGVLVDTRLAEAGGTRTEEVKGGCLCCRMSEFVEAADRLLEFEPEVIFAEPVGSCIDVSATVLQPIKQNYGERYRLAPFTVLVDPQRAEEMLSPETDKYLSYLFFNQIAEADLVCFTKADVTDHFPTLPTGFARELSARTGEGVAEWLATVLGGDQIAGGRLLEVDYQYYADAEATLGWLNWQGQLDLDEPLNPSLIVGPFLDELDRQLTEAGITIAHLKLLDWAASGFIKASVCRNGEDPNVEGDLTASPDSRHELLLNLRAVGHPRRLREIVSRVAGLLPGKATVLHFESFRPSPPKPQHRMDRIV